MNDPLPVVPDVLPGLRLWELDGDAPSHECFASAKCAATVSVTIAITIPCTQSGTPGALLAQGLFRHKTRKLSFKVVFVGIMLLQVALVYGYWRFVLRGT